MHYLAWRGEEIMNQHLVENLDDLKALVGQEVAVTDYRPISQERVNQFADTTEDRSVDSRRCRSGQA
jgi:acyl dehydratase